MVDGAEALASVPSPWLGETLPESREEGRDTDAGPSEIEPFEDLPRDPCDERDRDRGGLIAGGGKGGGSIGKIRGLSPPGTLESESSTGENVTDFFEPRDERLRSVVTFS